MDWKRLLQIFWAFTKIAMFSWGGGPDSLGLMQRETLAIGWVTADEFADNIALSKALPGPTASAFVGYKLAGWPGALAAVAGTVLPTTLRMLILISTFYTFKDNQYMHAAIQGIRPFVVGLLAWTAYTITETVFKLNTDGLGGSLLRSWDKWLIALATLLLLTLPIFPPASWWRSRPRWDCSFIGRRTRLFHLR